MTQNIDEILALARPRMATGYGVKLREWLKVNAEQRAFNAKTAADGTLELTMLDIIGEDWWTGGGITADRVKAQLDANKDAKVIKILMNSPGGDAFEGIAIQSLLKRSGARIEFEILGLAASAATVICTAGDVINIHEGAMFMIHPAWTFAMGNKADLRQTADFLEKVDSGIVDLYKRRTGRSQDEILPLFEATTWMTAHEAVKEKFASSVIPAKSGEENKAADAKAKALAATEQRAPAAASNMPRPVAQAPAKNGEGPTYEIGDRIFVPEPYEPGQTVGEVREAVMTWTYGIVFDGLESDGVYHWYVESELVPEADRADHEEPDEEATDSSTKAKAMAANNEQTTTPSGETITVAVAGKQLSDDERRAAKAKAEEAAQKAVEDHRAEEHRTFVATHPLARAGRPPAPPFGGLRNR